MNVLTIQGLSKAFGGQKIIDHLDMAVPEGSIFGFIGQNGAGKKNTGNVQFTHHDGLHIVGGVVAGDRAGVGVLIDLALAPHALRIQVQNILGAVTVV